MSRDDIKLWFPNQESGVRFVPSDKLNKVVNTTESVPPADSFILFLFYFILTQLISCSHPLLTQWSTWSTGSRWTQHTRATNDDTLTNHNKVLPYQLKDSPGDKEPQRKRESVVSPMRGYTIALQGKTKCYKWELNQSWTIYSTIMTVIVTANRH